MGKIAKSEGTTKRHEQNAKHESNTMDRETLKNLIPDHKTENRFVVRNDGRIYLVFGLASEVVLAQHCHFVGNELRLLPVAKFDYDEVSHTLDRQFIINDNGTAIEHVVTKDDKPTTYLCSLDNSDCGSLERRVTASNELSHQQVEDRVRALANELGWKLVCLVRCENPTNEELEVQLLCNVPSDVDNDTFLNNWFTVGT